MPSLGPGVRVGPYEIVSAIGAGGMGEVYRAHDTKLGRDVAIKVLPSSLTSDSDRLARFSREAQVLAALSHPNIAAIYHVEETAEGPAIVMELVEGETLAHRIARGPIPIDEALPIAKQIAEALEAAHEQGIIHRDLKPANIKLTPNGVVKVLDFGLAKLNESNGTYQSNGPHALSMSPTTTSPALMTGVGVLLGTAAYMAPEQAKGRPADKRTDIWAFGCVLYEMLTGTQAFRGNDVADVVAEVLKSIPDWDALPSTTPNTVTRLLRRCLEKDRTRRLDSANAARLDLVDGAAGDEGLGGKPLRTSVGLSRMLFAGVAVVTIAAFVGLAGIYFNARPVSTQNITLRLSAIVADDAAFNPQSVPALSPDGRKLVFSARSADGTSFLWVRDLDSSGSRLLTGTDDANYPFWSPDSRFVAFFADGKLKKIDVNAGTPLTICDAPNSYIGSWSSNDVIVFTPNFTSGLARVSAAGGVVAPITTLDAAAGEISHRYPLFLPDGHHFIYLSVNRDDAKSVVYVDDVDAKDRSSRRVLTNAQSDVAYADGRLLLVRGQTLMAAPFDVATQQLKGDFVTVADPIDSGTNTGQYLFSVSQNAVLAFASAVVGTDITLTWFDQHGKPSGTIGPHGDVQNPTIAPDGHAVAVDRRDPHSGTRDVWIYDERQATATRLTFNARVANRAMWSPDGSRIAFGTLDQGGQRIYQKTVTGSADAEPLPPLPGATQAADWSRDGRFVIANVQRGTTNWDVWVVPLGGKPGIANPFPVAETTAPERFPRLSPDGRWLAYQADLGTGNDIYVQAFPTASVKRQVSNGGGGRPVWSRDGKQLFYFASGKMWAVDVMSDASTFVTGSPRALFDVPSGAVPSFDVGPDGRFLIPIDAQSSGTPITIVTNWTGLLKR